MTLIVNMLGGPGTGKSTTAAGVFYELKQQGVNAELVTEYAKDLVWGRTTTTLGNQIYVFGKQYHRFWRLQDQVDVVVTDSPLILFLHYGEKQSQTFKDLVLEAWDSMDNLTWFLERVKGYNSSGRVQTESEARAIDGVLKKLLVDNGISHQTQAADDTASKLIAADVMNRL